MGVQTVKNVAAPLHVWRIRTAAPIDSAVARSAARKRWPVVLSAGAALALGLAAYIYFPADEGARSQGDARPDAAASGTVREVLPNSVAVLPFENLSPNPDDAYFAAGMHEEVISQLAKVRQLAVISRTSVMRYADTDQSIPQIAAELGVEALLEATVRYADNRVRIAAALIDASTERRLWREVYERDLADVFEVQADIAMNIANELGAEFSTAEFARIRRAPTASPEAYSLYLQAQHVYFSVSAGSPVARELIEQALEHDPDFALAHGSLASADALSLVNSAFGSAIDAAGRTELENVVRARARRALDLDPNVLAANAALASIDLYHWRWTAALEGFGRALELAPSDMPASGLGAWVNAWQGRRDEAMRIAEQGVRLNPGVAEPHRSLGIAHAYVGEFEAAVASLRTAHRIAPIDPFTSLWLASVEIALGNNAEGSRLLDLTDRVIVGNRTLGSLPVLAQGYARVGRPDDARRLFDEIQTLAREREVGAGAWAMAYIAIGEHDKALEYLEIAAEKVRNHEVDEGFWALNHLRTNITRNPTLERQEFQAVLTRLRGE
jgi:TolB-like protein/Tfp pilus assembly protein PilF